MIGFHSATSALIALRSRVGASAVAVVLAGLVGGAEAAPVLTVGTHQYFYTTAAGTWTAAEAEATARGGHLVAITTAAEQAALVAAFGGSERLWIGLTDAAVEGTFQWTDGEAFAYSNWSGGEPNDVNNVEDYVAMNWSAPGNWNDLPNAGFGSYDPTLATPARGIIEIVPEPDSIALVAIALVGLVAARRRRTAARTSSNA